MSRKYQNSLILMTGLLYLIFCLWNCTLSNSQEVLLHCLDSKFNCQDSIVSFKDPQYCFIMAGKRKLSLVSSYSRKVGIFLNYLLVKTILISGCYSCTGIVGSESDKSMQFWISGQRDYNSDSFLIIFIGLMYLLVWYS